MPVMQTEPTMTTDNSTPLSERFAANARAAAEVRSAFALDEVTAISLIGAPGSGKTSLLEALVRHVSGRIHVAAIIGNLAAARDAERIARTGAFAIPVQTDNLSAEHVRAAVPELNLRRTNLVLIEGPGNTLSPVEFDLGQDRRIAVFSVAGGDDKATAYPRLVAESDLVLLTKSDLLPHVSFDLDLFRADTAALNAVAQVLTVSARTGHGVDDLLNWLMRHWSPSKMQRARGRLPEPPADWLFG
jgi:hydrogenase nickel incorporation protein HypB